MAGVISKPDSISLSGNLNKFIMSASGLVLFLLKKGSETLLEQSYEPGPDGLVSIDIKDIVESQLSYKLDLSQPVYTQANLVADFTASIDSVDYQFRVIKAGVANLSDTAMNWLKLHFLTWQPKVKYVTYYSPEWLTYYAVVDCAVRLKATYKDSTTRMALLDSCQAGRATTFNLQYAVVAGLLDKTYPSYYEVYVEDLSGNKISEIQIYAFDNLLSEDEQWYLFENSLGGLDTFRAYGTNNLSAEHEHNIAEIADVKEEYLVNTERKYAKNTGYLDDYSRRWLLDFFPSKAKYVYDDTAIRKIVVTDSNVTYVSNELPSNYTFTWQLAEISPYLNLVKNKREIPDVLVAPDISAPDFIFPPRLAEFERIQLSEGVLIPAFSSNAPKPTVTTFGAVLNTVKNSVVKELIDQIPGMGGGGGSFIEIIKTDDLTIATDENVYSAARTDQELHFLLIESTGMFLRKDVPDKAREEILFAKKIGSDVFLDGFDGKGWEIKNNGAVIFESADIRSDIFIGNKFGSPTFAPGFAGWGVEIDMPTATGTFDNIFIRKNFSAYTITYSQIFGIGGSQIISDLNKIARVERLSDRWRCYMDDMEGLMLMNLRVGDGARIQSRTGTLSIKYLFGRVINIASDYFDIRYPALEGTGEPGAGDFVMRWGNNVDTTRQGLIYSTTSDQGAPFTAVYDGIVDISTQDKLKVQFGNIAGLRLKNGRQLSGYGAYLNSIFIENSQIFLDNGDTIEQNFSAMNGKFESEISGIKNDMSIESGNLLVNSSFGRDTNYWTLANTVHFIQTDAGYLWMDGSFYVDKEKVADIYKDGSRNVLRIRNTNIKQLNSVLSGEKKEGIYSFAFYYKVLREGKLSAGFLGSDLYVEEDLTVSDSYQKVAKVATWDGTGDFILQFTGEILLYGVSLFNDALADARIFLQTQITQNAEEIDLRATKAYVDAGTKEIYRYYSSEIKVTNERITQTVSKLEDGQKLISYINQTAGEITISANRVSLNGAVTFSSFDSSLQGQINGISNTANEAFNLSNSVPSWARNPSVLKAMEGETLIVGGFLNTQYIKVDNIEANKGKIAGFSITDNSLVNTDNTSFILISDFWGHVYLGGNDEGYVRIHNGSKYEAGLFIDITEYPYGDSGPFTPFAIQSTGSHSFKLGEAGTWSSPGVLYVGYTNGSTKLTTCWSVPEINATLEWITRDGDSVNRWRFTHNLGHEYYVPMLTAYKYQYYTVQAEQQTYPLVTNISWNDFEFTMKNSDNRAEIPYEPVIITILGQNK